MNEDCTFSELRDLFIDKSPLSRYEVINVGSIATNLVQGTMSAKRNKHTRKIPSSFLFCPIQFLKTINSHKFWALSECMIRCNLSYFERNNERWGVDINGSMVKMLICVNIQNHDGRYTIHQ